MVELEFLTIVPPWAYVLAAALLVLVLPRIAGYAVGALSIAAVLAISLLVPEGSHLQVAFLGFDAILFEVDQFTRMLGIGFGFLGTAAVFYAYSSETPRVTTAFALAYVAATFGAIFAGDWLTLVFFWELMAVTSTLLVWHYGGAAVRAGYRYAIAHGIGGSLVLFAVIWHYVEVGTFTYGAGAEGIAPGAPALLALAGIGVNLGFIGLHTWLPDTYPRPHISASVFLSVFTTKTSAYVLFRAFPEGGLFIAYMGGLMAVYGVVFALLQHDMRALLSYHIQAQVGYMVAGIGIGSLIGISGAMGHLFNNVLYKALLFMAVGVIIYRTREHDLYELGGLWREMPITAAAFAIGALSITAVPGFNGFISKGMVIDAANPEYYGAPEFQALYWLLLIGAVGTFLSFIKLGYYAFLHGEATSTVRDAKLGQSVGMLAVAALCVVFGLWWQGFVELLPYGPELIDEGQVAPYSIGHLTDAVILATVSVVGFKLIRKPLSTVGHVRDVDRWLNPLVFYTGKGTMLLVTETFAAVDRVAVRFVRTWYWIGNNPVLAVERVSRQLPEWLVEVDERRVVDGGERHRKARIADDEIQSGNGGVDDSGTVTNRTRVGQPPSTISLRAGIGITVLIVTTVLTAVLLILVLF